MKSSKKGNFLTFTSLKNNDSPFVLAKNSTRNFIAFVKRQREEIMAKIVVYDVHIFSIPSSNLLFSFVSKSLFLLASARSIGEVPGNNNKEEGDGE